MGTRSSKFVFYGIDSRTVRIWRAGLHLSGENKKQKKFNSVSSGTNNFIVATDRSVNCDWTIILNNSKLKGSFKCTA